jgi:hypothetical protein
MVEGRYGHGRCLLMATGATAAWSNLPVTPLFLPLMTNVVHALAGEASVVAPLRPGSARQFVFPGRKGLAAVDVTDPEGRTNRVEVDPSEGVPVFRNTYQTGVYSYRIEGEGTGEVGYFAVNPAPEESDLQTITPAELRSRFPGLSLHFAGSPEELEDVVAGIRQPYRFGAAVFWVLLFVVVAEGLLANRVTANISSSREEE